MARPIIFSLALSVFVAFVDSQPHGKNIVHRYHIHQRDILGTSHYAVKRNVSPNYQQEGPVSSKAYSYSSGSTQTSNVNNNETSLDTAGSGVDQEFPDGELSCSDFPSSYGAVPLNWVTKDGWASIVDGQVNKDNVGVCEDGDLCSYACPPGYSKAQWPDVQPASGASTGGLLCKNGKLFRTRKDYTKLCEPGVGNTSVVSKLDQFVAICRTDYPGSENMVIPLACTPGSSQTLTVPEADTSYSWLGKPTSAQYYANNAGVSLEEGCTWGQPNQGKGNWSPVVIGAGYRDNKTWLSIAKNSLNSDPLNYNIKIVVSNGGKMNGECRYENGVFYGATSTNGCTVALESGSATYVLY